MVAAAFLCAARLDVMPSTLWGRAESVRTALRQSFQGLEPLLFGIVSTGFGLELAFVVLSLPLVAAGVVLIPNRNRYLRDVVAAGRSEAHLSGESTN